jgi:taurine dioxygenase
LDPGTVARLREGLLKYKVLFFRDRAIDDLQQIRFTRYFGAVTPAHPVTNGLEKLPEIKINKLFAGIQEYASFRLDVDNPLRPLSRARNGRGWHIDITFVANPAAITVLRGVEIASVGGDTAWTDLEALYDGLPTPLKGFLDGLQAIHVRDDAANGLARPPRFDGRPPGPFASLHPLVRVHPETGRKSLFLSTGFVKAIALLDYLNDELSGHADYRVRFRWSPNLIAVWDNRSTSHFGPIDGPHVKEQRIVHRTTVGGALPVGPDGFVSRPLVGELFNTIS